MSSLHIASLSCDAAQMLVDEIGVSCCYSPLTATTISQVQKHVPSRARAASRTGCNVAFHLARFQGNDVVRPVGDELEAAEAQRRIKWLERGRQPPAGREDASSKDEEAVTVEEEKDGVRRGGGVGGGVEMGQADGCLLA